MENIISYIIANYNTSFSKAKTTDSTYIFIYNNANEQVCKIRISDHIPNSNQFSIIKTENSDDSYTVIINRRLYSFNFERLKLFIDDYILIKKAETIVIKPTDDLSNDDNLQESEADKKDSIINKILNEKFKEADWNDFINYCVNVDFPLYKVMLSSENRKDFKQRAQNKEFDTYKKILEFLNSFYSSFKDTYRGIDTTHNNLYTIYNVGKTIGYSDEFMIDIMKYLSDNLNYSFKNAANEFTRSIRIANIAYNYIIKDESERYKYLNKDTKRQKLLSNDWNIFHYFVKNFDNLTYIDLADLSLIENDPNINYKEIYIKPTQEDNKVEDFVCDYKDELENNKWLKFIKTHSADIIKWKLFNNETRKTIRTIFESYKQNYDDVITYVNSFENGQSLREDYKNK